MHKDIGKQLNAILILAAFVEIMTSSLEITLLLVWYVKLINKRCRRLIFIKNGTSFENIDLPASISLSSK
jgi:hypothetical protein